VFERFTERARQVVVLAQDEARALRHDHIGTEHLLLGLMREEPGVAARVLHEAGLEVDAVRDEVRRVREPEATLSFGHPIPFSPGAKAALEAGLRESLDVGHNFIGTEHILLGILRDPEPHLAEVLAGAGADVGDLVARAERALPGRSVVEIAPEILGFERLTEFARGAIVLAQEEARALHHNYVGTEHILLGLLRAEQGGAARALAAVGVTLEAARDRVRQTVGPGETVVVGQIPFTPHARRILTFAREEATALNHWSVGTEHLLLGLVGKHGGVATDILAELGAEPDRIRREVGALLSIMVFEQPVRRPVVEIPCPVCGASLERAEVVERDGESIAANRDGPAECQSCGSTFDLRYSIEWRPG
jgi:ATP-dependent Clp protease ATP-binding subunit ClpA